MFILVDTTSENFNVRAISAVGKLCEYQVGKVKSEGTFGFRRL